MVAVDQDLTYLDVVLVDFVSVFQNEEQYGMVRLFQLSPQERTVSIANCNIVVVVV